MKVHIVGTLDGKDMEEIGGKFAQAYKAVEEAYAVDPHGEVILGWDGEHEGQQELRALQPTSGRQTPPATPPIDLRFYQTAKGTSAPTTPEYWVPVADAISEAIRRKGVED